MVEQVVPNRESKHSKKQQVEAMFDSIAPRYDFLNHVLSIGIDKGWRKKVVRMVAQENATTILDIATGTADLAIALAKKIKSSQITGVDLSNNMLSIGKKKVDKLNFSEQIQLRQGDSEDLPFDDNSFDSATVAFGVRNFENLHIGLKEVHRTLKKGAVFVVLEFSQPQHFPVKQLYHFYFSKILPLIGRFISKDTNAYSYLPASVEAFPSGKKFLDKLQAAGFERLSLKPVTGGIATIYKAYK